MSDNNSDFGGPIFSAFRSFGENLKLPKVTVDDVVNHHKKNIRALEEAAKNTTAGAETVMASQRKALENALADITHMVQDARDGGLNATNARDILADQVAFAKQSFETTIQQASEIGSVVQSTNKDNLALLKDRMQGTIEELKSAIDSDDDDQEDDTIKPV